MDESRINLLRNVPLFSGLDQRDLRDVASTMKERRFSAGQVLAQEGQSGVGFFVIEEGQAKVDVGGQDVRRLGPGDYFGEIALIADSPRTATITAETPMLALGLTSWEFRPIVETNASIAWKLLEALAKKFHETEVRAAHGPQ
ncbi:MAG TPA: cyclic nucleotide-binding domain-containing protein [Gaiellaceae bacterium]|jgi:CRP-like cAMP-binding protein|nr:cyclic nucleotide-binding domain-containing protein [Gaiellaceae bacterium]